MKWFFLILSVLLGVFILASCGGPMQYVENIDRAPTAASHITVMYSEPQRAYEIVGIINWDYSKSVISIPSITDVLPRLKEKAAQEGGDAIIIRKQDILPLTENVLRLIIEVIKFKQ